MGADEISGVGELRMVAPDVPDLARRHGNIDGLLDPLNQLSQPIDVVLRKRPFQRFGPFVFRLRFRFPNPLVFFVEYPRALRGFEPGFGYRPKVLDRNRFTPEHGFVADHDPDDIAVASGQVDDGLDLALVAVLVLVDPGADRDLDAEFRGNRRHQFVAFRRGVQADRSRQGGEFLQVGANLLSVAVSDGVTRFKRRVGEAGQDAPEIGGRLLFLEQAPQPGVSRGHKQQNGDDGTHRRLNHTGLRFKESEPVPWVRPTRRHH